MFKSTLFTIVFAAAFSLLQGQSYMQDTTRDPAIDQLEEAVGRLERDTLITAWEGGKLLEEYRQLALRRREMGDSTVMLPERDYTQPYILLDLVEQAKTFSTSGTSYDLHSFVAAPGSSRKKPRAAIQAELDSFIHRLDRSGLISTWTTQELRRKNCEGVLNWQMEVANVAAFITNQEYFLRPEKVRRFVDSLHAFRVISDDRYRLLMEKSQKGELHQFAELASYVSYCVVIPLKHLPRDKGARLDSLFAISAKVYPGLRYDAIHFRREKDERESTPGFEVYNLVTTIRYKDKWYSYSGGYEMQSGKKDVIMPVPESYYSIFNKVLEDRSSDYRVHSMPIDADHYGLIALTAQQVKQFNWMYDGANRMYLQVSNEKYSNKLTQDRITRTIHVYDSLGLFSGLSAAEKDSCLAQVKLQEINYYSDLLRCFKHVVFDLDLKNGIDTGQYAEATRNAALISRGGFRPEAITDSYSYEHPDFVYGFKLNGKTYTANLHHKGKWMDPNFWALIDSAEKVSDVHGRFYYIYPSDGLSEIYLTNEQYGYLREHGLLEFEEVSSAEVE